MKKAIFTLLLVATAAVASAQRFAYVDTEYILENVPEYATAQAQLDEVSKNWQKEIETKLKEVDQLYRDYQKEQVLLTDEMRQQRQKTIEDREKAAKDLQKQRFGFEGDLFKKRQELVKPVQDKVYEAIQKVATTKGYDVIFDKSSGVTMLYASTKLDVSDDVIKQLGYAPKSK
ncbi:MAG TPA: OmpH family outer membrane protein [Chitinophagales bacterium]|nr:OmpH family outer membrane protein [Chitinophagales bacterium]